MFLSMPTPSERYVYLRSGAVSQLNRRPGPHQEECDAPDHRPAPGKARP